MNIGNLLNEDPSPGPGRSASIASRGLQRTPSISHTVSPASSNVTHTSPPRTSHPSNENGSLRPTSVDSTRRTPNVSPRVITAQSTTMTQLREPWPNTSQKRSAPVEDAVSPAKRQRHRKYAEKPIWARLSPRNPRSKGIDQPDRKVAGNGKAQANGASAALHPPTADGSMEVHWSKPWLNAMPLDLDLLKAQRILGGWEKSMRYSTPYPDMHHRISDWLVSTLRDYREAVDQAGSATFEVEAKIGTLIHAQSGQPAKLPVETMTLLAPSVQRDYRFESELQLVSLQSSRCREITDHAKDDFAFLNKMLNATLASSVEPGRQAIKYARRDEIDSFTDLSPEGIESLPQRLQSLATRGKELRLRTTRAEKSGEVIACIVKVPIDHRQIFNPYGYACRISINVEVDFMQANIKPMTIAPTIEKPAQPDRKKHRLSYTHLDTYSIDLTTVHISALAPKYELEVEVDSKRLLQQMDLMLGGQSQNAFGDVVSGFMDNTQFLMRGRTV